MTGINVFNAELAAKRLGLLRELVPRTTGVAVLVSPAEGALTETQLKQVEAAARAMGVQSRVFKPTRVLRSTPSSKSLIASGSRRSSSGPAPFLNGRRRYCFDSEQFRSAPRTCRPLCGSLSMR
jgi:hypothetical protein